MASRPEPAERSIDSALLVLSREPRVLAELLRRALPAGVLQDLARQARRRKAGKPQPEAQLAETVAQQARLRQAVAEALHRELPTAEVSEPDDPWLAVATRLRSTALSDWEDLAAELAATDATWPPPHAEPEPPAPSAASAAAVAAAPPAAPPPAGRERDQEKILRLQEQLRAARRQLAELQEDLGAARRSAEQAQRVRERAQAKAESERGRAAELKQQLAAAEQAGPREQRLDEDLRAARHELHVLQQKLDWLEDERDDLRGVLADHDRFDAVDEAEVPSFRDRPLTAPEQALAEQLASRADAGRPSFRVLVVGGGQPQHRHRDKLLEYAEAMGFRAEWRMAEYQAWHRALDGLRRDMQERFDALIILHWNRTTFTRKAREICDTDGAKPCLTCHYEGFTNLRESLQECLRELLAGETRAGA